jgi:AraC-type DNA-binding domain-containing proteins
LPERTNRQLAELLAPQITAEGFSPSPLPGVEYMRAVVSTPRHPIVYTPRIVVIAQGHKRVWLGEKEFVYDPDHLLVLSVPMPFECQTTASEEEPLLGLAIGVDPILVGELLLEMGDAANAEPSSYVSSTAIDPEVMDAAVRLAETLGSSADCRIIGPQIVREIVYRVLTGEQGDVLRLLTAQTNRHGQIARVLRRIHADYADELDVPSLAREANMGISTFHHAFRDATATSPLQYVKSIRLHKARALLVADGLNAQDAARRVGYVSASQFSREYRRMFGCSPASDRAAVPA